MGNINELIRRTSVMVDTSGKYPAPAIQTSTIMSVGGGVYPQTSGSSEDTQGDIFAGRISLGIVAAFIVGAIAFYVWTNNIQGGG